MIRLIPLFIAVFFLQNLLFAQHQLYTYDLKTDHQNNPLGIDNLKPQLSWKVGADINGVNQSAFRIQIATTKEALLNKVFLIDEKIETAFNAYRVNTLNLKSKSKYFWRVMVWDESGSATNWSNISWWEMGLINAQDWEAKWVRNPNFMDDSLSSKPAPFFRKEFDLKGIPKKGRVYVTGLGYFKLYINGVEVGDHQLDPVKTRYDKRVKYLVHDITQLLKPGKNVVGMILGTGWYNHFANAVWGFNKAPWRSYPELLCQLEISTSEEEVKVISDNSWLTKQGPILFDGIRNGETYDARVEMPDWNKPDFDDNDWLKAVEVEGPQGKLSAQVIEPIKEMVRVKPISVNEVEPNVWVFDLGQNIAGYCELKTAGPQGTKITLKHGEKLFPDGKVEQKQILRFLRSGEAQTDTYILKGSGEEIFKPHFVYHGFQYIEVRGLAHPPTLETLTGIVLHTSFEEKGNFSSSDPILNRLQQNTKWSFIGNYHGLPTDCPHREKIGWTGDAQLVAESGLLNYDVYKAYVKWLDDFVDEQQTNGDLPGIIPSSGWGYEHGKNPVTRKFGYGPQWEGAFVQMTWDLYQHSGDTAILKRFYNPIKKYIDFLLANAENYTLNFGIDDHKPVTTKTEGDILASGYLYGFINIMQQMALALQNEDDAKYFASLLPKIKKGFNKKYYDKSSGKYGNGGQTSQVLALYFKLVEEKEKQKVLNVLLDDIDSRDKHFDVGVVGLKFLFNVLMEEGYSDILYEMVTQKDIPGFAYWLEQGANTLWQDWDGSMSLNHIMFGTVSEWFFESLAGIRLDANSPGMAHFYIKPDLLETIDWVSANHENRYGKIVSAWHKQGKSYSFNVEIPTNSTASFYLPLNHYEITYRGKIVELENNTNIYQKGNAYFLRLYAGKHQMLFSTKEK